MSILCLCTCYVQKKRPKKYPSEKSQVVRDFKLFIAVKDTPETVKAKIVDGTVPQIKEFNAKVLANVFHSCKQGSFFHVYLFRELARRVNDTKHFVNNLTSVEMSMLIHSLGFLARMAAERSSDRKRRLGQIPFPGFGRLVQNLVKECLWREKTEYRRTDCQGMGNIIQGLGLILKHTKLETVEFQARQVVNLGLKKLAKVGKLAEVPPQTIASTLQGCASLEIKNDDILDLICEDVKRRLLEVPSPNRHPMLGVFSRVWKHADSDRSFSVGDDANSWMMQEMAMKRFPSQSLANIVGSLGELEHYHKPAMAVIEQEVIKRLGTFRACDLFNLLQGLVRMKQSSREVLDNVCDELCKNQVLAALADNTFADLVMMIGEVQYRNSIAMDAVGTEASKESRATSLTDQQLCSVIEGLADIGFHKKSVLDSLFQELETRKKLANHPSGTLVATIRAIHKLHYKDAAVLEALSRGLLKLDKLRHLNETSLMQILQAYGALGYKHEGLLSRLGFEMVMRGRLHRYGVRDRALRTSNNSESHASTECVCSGGNGLAHIFMI